MKKIKVLIVEIDKEPKIEIIDNNLETLEKIVGGLIEVVELDSGTDLICNEEGKLLHLKLNRVIPNDIICGTFIITGQKNGREISLTEEQIEKWKYYFRLKRDNLYIKFLNNNLLNSEVLLNFNLIGIEDEIELSKKELEEDGRIKKEN